jgi:hypothetical protein
MSTTQHTYQRMRQAGYSAKDALRNAKIVAEWQQAEADGLVRLLAEPEEECYYDVFGEPEAYTDVNGRRVSEAQARAKLDRLIELHGVWIVIAEYRTSEDDAWQRADSIGMNAGYRNPLDPVQNAYVPDLMQSALRALEAQALAPSL